jgi:hypothetical protein
MNYYAAFASLCYNLFNTLVFFISAFYEIDELQLDQWAVSNAKPELFSIVTDHRSNGVTPNPHNIALVQPQPHIQVVLLYKMILSHFSFIFHSVPRRIDR